MTETPDEPATEPVDVVDVNNAVAVWHTLGLLREEQTRATTPPGHRRRSNRLLQA